MPTWRRGRTAAVCRELTKLHEEVRRDTLVALADAYAAGAETRGEFVLVIAPPQERAPSAEEIDERGHLVVEKANEERVALGAGEVHLAIER